MPPELSKPKPYIYLEIAKRLGVRPVNCLVFEDTQAGIEAASNAGMVVIAVPNELTQDQDFSKAMQVLNSLNGITAETCFELIKTNQELANKKSSTAIHKNAQS